jgi:hypothetical protein
MWGFSRNVSVAYIKPIATEAFWTQSAPGFWNFKSVKEFLDFAWIFSSFTNFEKISGVLSICKKISRVLGISGIFKNFRNSSLISDN